MADSFASYDVARLAFDGANASTTLSDALGHTFTCNGAAALSTATPVYGTAALALNGSSGCTVSAANTADWNMGSGDFDVEFFWKPTTVTTCYLFAISDNSTHALTIQANASGALSGTVSIGGTTYTVSWPSSTLAAGRNYHIALVRTGTTLTLYVDGNSYPTTGVLTIPSGALAWNTSMLQVIGGTAAATATTPYGSVDQLRVTKGSPRYSAAFLPMVDGSFNQYDTTNITTTTLGTRTLQVTTAGTPSQDAVINATEAAILALGWSLYDSYNQQGQVTKVYSRLNADAATYKYAVVIWDRVRRRVHMTSCESWSIANKTLTNECWSNLRSQGTMGFSTIGCDIIIFGAASYLGLMTYIQGSPSTWAMVVESEREAAEDTAAAGYPCWAVVYGENFLVSNSTNRSDWIRYPRTRDGLTGQSAANGNTQVASFGAFGPLGASFRWGNFFNNNSTLYKNAIHAWDTNKKLISHLKCTHDNQGADTPISIYGRLFALKAASAIGNTMDRVSVPVDSDLFYGSGGTATDHWVLPNFAAGNTQAISGAGGSAPSTVTLATGNSLWDVVHTGSATYCSTNTAGVYKYDHASGAYGLVSGTTGLCYDVVFDGRYVYAAMTSGVYRIDTQNADAVTTISTPTLTGGARRLAFSGKQFLFATDRTASTTPKIVKIDLLSQAVVTTFTMGARTTSSLVNIAFGNEQLAAVVINPTTAADRAMSFTGVDASAIGAWGAQTAAVGQQSGVSWTGSVWMVTYAANAGGITSEYYQPNTTTGATSLGSNAVANSDGSGRSYGDRTPLCAIFCSNATTAIPTGYGVNGAPDFSAASPAAFGTQGAGPTNGAWRGFYWTGNSLVVIGNDNSIYYSTNIFQRSTANVQQPNALIPR